jgi:hypothetical protein
MVAIVETTRFGFANRAGHRSNLAGQLEVARTGPLVLAPLAVPPP